MNAQDAWFDWWNEHKFDGGWINASVTYGDVQRAFLAGFEAHSAPSGMTREALAEVVWNATPWSAPALRGKFGDANSASRQHARLVADRILAAFPAVGQEPAAVRPPDRVTDEMVEAALWEYEPLFPVEGNDWEDAQKNAMRAALEAALKVTS